jgi:hypothetical protein
MTAKKETYNEFISDLSNHDTFFVSYPEIPELQVLTVFFEDRQMNECELEFKINLN